MGESAESNGASMLVRRRYVEYQVHVDVAIAAGTGLTDVHALSVGASARIGVHRDVARTAGTPERRHHDGDGLPARADMAAFILRGPRPRDGFLRRARARCFNDRYMQPRARSTVVRAVAVPVWPGSRLRTTDVTSGGRQSSAPGVVTVMVWTHASTLRAVRCRPDALNRAGLVTAGQVRRVGMGDRGGRIKVVRRRALPVFDGPWTRRIRSRRHPDNQSPAGCRR